MKVLVTGGTGFVGLNVCRSLMRRGDEVVAIVREGSYDRSQAEPLFSEGVKLLAVDPEYRSLYPHVRELRPDVVLHLAATLPTGEGWDAVEQVLQANVTMGVHLLEAMRIAGVRRFVGTGTIWQHLDGSSYSPVDLYAASKQAFADLLVFYQEAHDFRATTLELTDTYGPGDRRRKFVNILLDAARRGEPLDATMGDQEIDLVHVRDAAEAFAVACQLVVSDLHLERTYHVSSGLYRTVRELAAECAEAIDRDIDVRWGARPYRKREMMRAWRGGRRLPGWRPQIDLKTGVRELWEAA